ncbi:MAG: nucleoside triphosphate pyrophosphohydrolase [Sphingomonadales bacterium]|nr:nucleoside triphosphate pyrophosphohydrolase [Sphingomonadales bacterium]
MQTSYKGTDLNSRPSAASDAPAPLGDRNSALKAFDRLLTIMDELREQCPWDREQTMESLSPLTIEELYELTDAILTGQSDEICRELGDLMLHLVFYARIAREQGTFDVAGVLTGVCDKLVARHPHIYGEVQVSDAAEVKRNWEKLKLREGNTSVLAGVPASLPALVKAMRIQEKARGVGFDWIHRGQVWDKVQEEWSELHEAEAMGDPQRVEDEFGDVLFSVVNYSRFLAVNPENALSKASLKFIRRFRGMEDQARAEGRELQSLSPEDWDALWNRSKSL